MILYGYEKKKEEARGKRVITPFFGTDIGRFSVILGKISFAMVIERTTKNKLVITISSAIDSYGLQRLIDYVKYLETTSKSKAKQSDADKLAEEVNTSWWTKNKKRFVK